MIAQTTLPVENQSQKTGVPAAYKVPSGPACAAVLATSIGAAAYGVAVTAAEMYPAVKKFLIWSKPVGPLSGATSTGVIVWLVAQVILCALWHNREVNFKRVWFVASILIAVSFALTFPMVYDAVAAK